MDKDKILHVITTIELGGAEKQLSILVKSQVGLGLDVSVLYLKGKPDLKEDLINSGVTVLDSLANKPFYRQLIQGKKIFDDKAIVHAHLPRSEIFAFILSRRFQKLIITRHNAELFFSPIGKILSSAISRFILMKSAGVIAITESVKDFIITGNEICVSDQHKIHVIRYGIERVSSEKYFRKHANTLKILCISRLTLQKDLPTLLEAIRLLKQKFSLSLTIVGRGHLLDELTSIAHEYEIDSCITWIEKTKDVNNLYRNADLFILTSKYEGLGLVLLEAMVNNLPIIASDAKAIVEVLGENYSGLFPVGDAISLVEKISDIVENDRFSELNSQAQSRLLLFDVEKMTRAVLLVYGKVY